ncbi:Flp family type IVb pilin [Ornithinimicrobium kibberense]|uniref:Flp family type IVb pilin n=1 Tax=Ornithinimicrobium kibberense TaxID=282060 RepID=A0ABV5V334_9MICO|nr:Flp family type IVb pilin [Ornithinimicrobium kibberense]
MAALFYTLATLKARLGDKERGAGVVEYALVIGGISIVLILGATALNTGLTNVWNDIRAYLNGLVTTP